MTIFGIGDSSENCTFLTTKWDEAARMGCKFGITRATTTGVVVCRKTNFKTRLKICGKLYFYVCSRNETLSLLLV